MSAEDHAEQRIDEGGARRPSTPAIVARALLYALAITLLVIYAPEQVEFVYMGF
jgi:hypothetical protein